MSDRMRRAYERYNKRVLAVAGEEAGSVTVGFDMTNAPDDPVRHLVAGTDVSFDELMALAEQQAASFAQIVVDGRDPIHVMEGFFRAAFLVGVFFEQDLP